MHTQLTHYSGRVPSIGYIEVIAAEDNYTGSSTCIAKPPKLVPLPHSCKTAEKRKLDETMDIYVDTC